MTKGAAGFSGFRDMVDRTMAPVLWRPWTDRVATPGVAKLFFPLSRAWASAILADGDAEAFQNALQEDTPRKLVGSRVLSLVSRRWAAYKDAESHWQDAFFGTDELRPAQLYPLQKRRIATSKQVMALRAAFLPSHLERPFPSLLFELDSEAEVERRHGHRLSLRDGGTSPDLRLPVVESQHVIEGPSRLSWLRYPTPEGVDSPLAFARVRAPAHSTPRATLIFAHGIGRESELWGETGTVPDWFAARGFCVIEPEGPWHSQRVLPGQFGGESIFGRGPGGLLDYSWAHLRELGRLIAWAHQRFSGPVMLSGVSLGALTAMQALSWANQWPTEARPDSAFLIAPAASLVEVAYRGSLTGQLGIPEALLVAGWTEEKVSRWTSLLDAGPKPVTHPDKTVVILGTEDEITPFPSGQDLAQQWHIPPENLWTRKQGHFTVALGLTSAPDPLYRALNVALS